MLQNDPSVLDSDGINKNKTKSRKKNSMPKLNLASSQRVKVRVLEYTNEEILALANNPTTLGLITTGVNDDRRQKVALVDFRADLSEKLEALQFKRTTKTVIKDGKEESAYDETEGEHIGRFIVALSDGTFTPSGFTYNSTADDKQKTNAALAYLQTIANECGDNKTDDGLACYKLDIARQVRERKGPGIPKWAQEQATEVYNLNGGVKAAHLFRTGFTNPAGIVIDPFPFEDFTEHVHAHATPEERETHRKTMIVRLARAFQEVEAQVRAKTAKTSVAQFA